MDIYIYIFLYINKQLGMGTNEKSSRFVALNVSKFASTRRVREGGKEGRSGGRKDGIQERSAT